MKQFCDAHATWFLDLGRRITPTGIERLYWRHVRASDGNPDVIAEIAGDPRTPLPVIRDIWARFRAIDMGIMSVLACNPSAPKAMLRELQRVRDSVVREHARLTLKSAKRVNRRNQIR